MRNLQHLSLLILSLSLLAISCAFQSNEYETVKIGEQYWMAKNLDISTFRNGDLIKEAKDDKAWRDACDKREPAWCYYNNDPTLGKTYGKLYNIWAIIDKRMLAPEGWHIPSEEEWKILYTACGGKELAGDQLKEEGTEHWKSPNNGANNRSGFCALPGGHREYSNFGNPTFVELGEKATFWSSSVSQSTKSVDSQVVELAYFNHRVREYGIGCIGLSVRCLKD